MKYKALLIATVAAATLSFAGFAQALTNAQSGSLMERDGGHTGAARPANIKHAPHFPGPIVHVFTPHHYRHYRHY